MKERIENENDVHNVHTFIIQQRETNDIATARIDELASAHNTLVSVVERITECITRQSDINLQVLDHLTCTFTR